jgi:hypothetical protein
MINICPQQGCDAVYDLTDADVGRSFPCKKCGAMLLVEPDGLRMLSRGAERVPAAGTPALPPLPADAPSPARTTPENPSMRPMDNNPNSPINTLFTILFAVGASLVVVFVFLPLLDQTRISSRNAAINAGNDRIKRMDNPDAIDDSPFGPRPRDLGFDKEKDVDKKDKDAQTKTEKPGELTDAEKKKRREDWAKEKKDLEERVADSRTFAQQAMHYYTWGMMLGFLLLAVGGVGFLSPSQPIARKVVGAVVLCAQVVAIFLYYYFVFIRGTFLSFGSF